MSINQNHNVYTLQKSDIQILPLRFSSIDIISLNITSMETNILAGKFFYSVSTEKLT